MDDLVLVVLILSRFYIHSKPLTKYLLPSELSRGAIEVASQSFLGWPLPPLATPLALPLFVMRCLSDNPVGF